MIFRRHSGMSCPRRGPWRNRRRHGGAIVGASLGLLLLSSLAFSQVSVVPPTAEIHAPDARSCSAGLKFFDSPFFKICYPQRWHVIHGFDVNYAWWMFSKRKRGEKFHIPYIRVIIAQGIAQPHLAKESDSALTAERTYIKATNEFKDYTGTRTNRRHWRQIVVGPAYDILAWYDQIKPKQVKQFDRALDSFWVPPPPRVRPERPVK